jgi:hypothetical protein
MQCLAAVLQVHPETLPPATFDKSVRARLRSVSFASSSFFVTFFFMRVLLESLSIQEPVIRQFSAPSSPSSLLPATRQPLVAPSFAYLARRQSILPAKRAHPTHPRARAARAAVLPTLSIAASRRLRPSQTAARAESSPPGTPRRGPPPATVRPPPGRPRQSAHRPPTAPSGPPSAEHGRPAPATS